MKIMLDLETLGTKPGCKILSISAVTFCAAKRHYLDIFVKPDSQPLLATDAKTYQWWQGQDADLVKFTFENEYAVPLAQALYMFTEWYKALGAKGPEIWGNGATFDAPVLRAAYEYLGIEVPWNFRDERCYRTLKAEFGSMVELPAFTGKLHRGLHDATYQANCAELILNKIHNRR